MIDGTLAQESLLRVVQGTKTYRGVHAIEGLDFDLRAGEVHALVGENGAGKSTLCKVVSGAIQLDAGEIWLGGRQVRFRTPRQALGHGIAMVYQETSLVPTMTVAQNIELGHEKMIMGLRRLNIAAQQLLQSMNFHVDPSAYVSTLGAAKKQMVEIARAIRTNAGIIIFDEPTATLTPEETLHLFQVIGDLREAGLGIIYVSHALEESLQIADRITVMRDGRRVVTESARALTKDDIVHHMVGRTISPQAYTRRPEPMASRADKREPVLRVENVTMGTVVKNMSFSAYPGEVLGVAGLVGSGRTEIARIVIGMAKRNRIHGGAIYLRGRPIRFRVPKQAIEQGVAYVTEDRKVNGFFETMSVGDNIFLGFLSKNRRLLYSRRQRAAVATPIVKRLGIRGINPDAKAVELSGGNQQKLVIAKSLVQDPDLVIFDEPTRGVDVGAIEEIHKTIRDLAAAGKAVVVISSYLPEVLSISDRILVARLGRVVAEFGPDATQEQVMYAAIY